MEKLRINDPKTNLNEYYSGGVVWINHKGRVGEFKKAKDLLSKEGAPAETVDRIFDSEGKFRQASRQPNPELMSPFLLAECMEEAVRPLYDLVDYSVNTIYPYGFIRHNMSHVERVLARGYSFLSDANDNNPGLYKDRESFVTAEKVFVAAALGHDTGNLQGRDEQTELSIRTIRNLFPDFLKFPDFLAKLEDVIRFHSNSRFEKTIANWNLSNADAIVERIQGEFPTELLALFLGDKVDRGRQRIHPKSGTHEAFDSNEHIALNFFGSTIQARFDNNGKIFRWGINVSDKISEDDLKNFPEIAENQTAYVPSRIREKMEQEGKPFFDVFQERLWEVSSVKLFQTIMVAFAMSPSLEEFHFKLTPDIAGDQKSQPQEIVFKRNELQKTMDEIKGRFKLN